MSQEVLLLAVTLLCWSACMCCSYCKCMAQWLPLHAMRVATLQVVTGLASVLLQMDGGQCAQRIQLHLADQARAAAMPLVAAAPAAV